MTPWLNGLQKLVCFFAKGKIDPRMCWTVAKLRVQKLRLKLSSEVERSEHKDVLRVLTNVVQDAAWGVSNKSIALSQVCIDIKAEPMVCGTDTRVCQSV